MSGRGSSGQTVEVAAAAVIALVVLSMRHTYISTACQHARHKRCQVKCKFCTATCLCKCHAEHPSDRLRKHLDRKFGQEEKAN